MSDDRKQRLLAVAMAVRPAVLHIDDSDHAVRRRRDDGHGQKRFVFIFGQSLEDLKSTVLACVPRDRYQLNLLRHPSRDALADAHGDLPHQPGVRIL